MGSREGGTTSSGSSTDSIDGDVLGMHASRSMSSQPEGNIDTITISSDSEPSGNSEITNRNETTQDPLSLTFTPVMFDSPLNETGEPSENSEPTTQSHVLRCRHTDMPLILESQDSESSNLDTNSQEPSENSETTQSQDPDKCRQIFATETQFDLVCPEDGDESNENPDESTEKVDESSENTDEGTEIVDESTENADVSIDTVVFEASDYTENTQTLSQYVTGSDTQDITQEMYPATLSQCSEPLPRSARRHVQVYEFDSEPASDPLDSSYVPPACEFPPPLRREDAITPSTSSKHDLDSTEVDSDENEPPKKKKKEK